MVLNTSTESRPLPERVSASCCSSSSNRRSDDEIENHSNNSQRTVKYDSTARQSVFLFPAHGHARLSSCLQSTPQRQLLHDCFSALPLSSFSTPWPQSCHTASLPTQAHSLPLAPFTHISVAIPSQQKHCLGGLALVCVALSLSRSLHPQPFASRCRCHFASSRPWLAQFHRSFDFCFLLLKDGRYQRSFLLTL